MKWLEKDIAAVTYNASDNNLHQYIGTNGNRNGGNSYSYIGPSIHGQWKGDKVRVTSAPKELRLKSTEKLKVMTGTILFNLGP